MSVLTINDKIITLNNQLLGHEESNLAFYSGSLDFTNKLWRDESGNNNHAFFKNAYARIGNNPLDTSNNLLTNLTHYYNFTEPSGTSLDDKAGSIDGSIGTVTQDELGIIAKAYYFSSGYVTLQSSITWTGDYTVSCWIKITQVTNATAGYVFIAYSSGNSLFSLYQYNRNMNFQIRGSDNVGISTVTKVNAFDTSPLPKWYHIIAERDTSSDKIRLYVNNGTAAEATDNTTADSVTNLRIGTQFVGHISEIGIWNRLLTSSERALLYNSYKGLTYPFTKENLYYQIDGLLTTDTITVQSGSHTPTIPYNDILLIDSSQIVYGVTVTRASETWAVIPFCEPKINNNLPTISYDVYGGGHHATCSILTANNLITQNNYFYLMKHGYSERLNNLVDWDFTSWSGSFPDQRFAGTYTVNASTSANRYIEPYGDDGLRFYTDASYSVGFVTLSSQLEASVAYVATAEVLDSSGTSNATGLTIAGFTDMTQRLFHVGLHKYIWTQSATGSVTLTVANSLVANDVAIRDYFISKHMICPGLITKNGSDALGNAIEFAQTGNRWLRYGGDMNWPNMSSAMNVSDNAYGNLLKSGYLSSTKKYIIESTETNYFGTGITVGTVITGDNSTVFTPSNTGREMIQENLFKNKDVSYGNINHIGFRCYYTNKNLIKYANQLDSVTTAALGYSYRVGLTYVPDQGYFDKLAILKTTINNSQHLNYHSTIGVNPSPKPLLSYTMDGTNYTEFLKLKALFDPIGARANVTMYQNMLSVSELNYIQDLGNYIPVHNPYLNDVSLSSYKGWYETEENYTAQQLGQWYSDGIAAHASQGFPEDDKFKIHLGGQSTELTESVVLNYFKAGFTTDSAYTLLPLSRTTVRYPVQIDRYTIMPRHYHTGSNTLFGYIVTYQMFGHYYGHLTTDASYIIDLSTALSSLATRQKNGENIRIYKLDDCFDVIDNII